MKELGTTDREFAKELFEQLLGASERGAGEIDREALFFPLAVIKDAASTDKLVTMQIAQMALVHTAMMRVSGQLERARSIPERDSAMRAFNQLARTYTAQLEGVKRYRTGGEQKVTVQNVSVTEGGQAIVGNVARASLPEEHVATPTLTDGRQPAMKIPGERERMPVLLRNRARK
jgi:hypothetical protein